MSRTKKKCALEEPNIGTSHKCKTWVPYNKILWQEAIVVVI